MNKVGKPTSTPPSFARRSGITLLFWLFSPSAWADSRFIGFSRPAPGRILALLASLTRRLGEFLLYWLFSPSAWANSCFIGSSCPAPGQILALLASLARRLGEFLLYWLLSPSPRSNSSLEFKMCFAHFGACGGRIRQLHCTPQCASSRRVLSYRKTKKPWRHECQRHSYFQGLEKAQAGFEPADTGVADHCLTTWLLRHPSYKNNICF